MQTLHSMNRRQALAASVATLAAGTIPAAADDERTEWLGLWHAYCDQEQRHVAATDAYLEADWQGRQSYPPQHIRTARTWCGCGDGKPLG